MTKNIPAIATSARNVEFTNGQTTVVGLGKAGEITVETSRLTSATIEWIFAYGLKQVLNDAHASEKEPEAKRALVEKKLEGLYAGRTSRAPGGPRAAADPVAKEAGRMARARYKAFSDEQRAELAERFDEATVIAKLTANLMDAARATVEAMNVEVDLG